MGCLCAIYGWIGGWIGWDTRTRNKIKGSRGDVRAVMPRVGAEPPRVTSANVSDHVWYTTGVSLFSPHFVFRLVKGSSIEHVPKYAGIFIRVRLLHVSIAIRICTAIYPPCRFRSAVVYIYRKYKALRV